MATLLRPRFLVLAGVLAAATMGCKGPVAGGKADGPAVFAEACARCHGGGGRPSPSMRAQLGVRDLTSAEFKAQASAAQVADQVRRGSDNKVMPAFAGELSEDQIAAVAAYVLGLPASD